MLDTENKTIILADRLYDIIIVDRLFLEKISNQGIYKLKKGVTLEDYFTTLISHAELLNIPYNELFHVKEQSPNVSSLIKRENIMIRMKVGEKQEFIEFEVSKDNLANKTFSYLLIKMNIVIEDAYMWFTLINEDSKETPVRLRFDNRTNGQYWLLLPFNSSSTEYIKIEIGRLKVATVHNVLLQIEDIYIL